MKNLEKEFKQMIKEGMGRIAENWKKLDQSPTVLVVVGEKTCGCKRLLCEHADVKEFPKDECPYPNSRF